jgi:hypothetical protein
MGGTVTAAIHGEQAGVRTTTPFRADHVGSFLRLKFLLQVRERFRSGTIDAAQLREDEDQAIRGVVSSRRNQCGEAAKFAPLEQRGLSPQCRFSSALHGNDVAGGVAGAEPAARDRGGARGVGRCLTC